MRLVRNFINRCKNDILYIVSPCRVRTPDKLRLLQDVLNVTQEELARLLQVSFVTLNRWMNAKAEPRAGALRRIDALLTSLGLPSEKATDPLPARKAILAAQARKHPDVLNAILREPDIHDEFVLKLTFTSNRIEGSTLTEAETAMILFQNGTVPRKTLTEQLEAKNHQVALDYLFAHLAERGHIDKNLILRLHGMLMNGIRDDAGSYRRHTVRIVGANIPTANYLRVPSRMADLLASLDRRPADIIQATAQLHSTFEQIHPFSDGNGRIGRLILHAQLLSANLPPAIIRPERRQEYITALNLAQRTGDMAKLEEVICRGVLEGWRIVERQGV